MGIAGSKQPIYEALFLPQWTGNPNWDNPLNAPPMLARRRKYSQAQLRANGEYEPEENDTLPDIEVVLPNEDEPLCAIKEKQSRS